MTVLSAASAKQQKVVDAFLSGVQFMVIGGAMGSGKSYLMSMLTTMLMDDPNTRVGFFRETLRQLEDSGGLVDTTKSIYGKISDALKYKAVAKPYPGITIKSGPGQGARIEFRPLNSEADLENARGLQYTMIGIDEGTCFSQTQIEFLMARLRSQSRHSGRMIVSCNPDPDHYLCRMIEDYYLDEEGYPIEDRAGDIRYYLRRSGEYFWGNSKEEVAEILGEELTEELAKKIMSFTFIGMTIYDNPVLLKEEPGYLAHLEGLGRVEKARNLHGNWFMRAESSGLFKRQWLKSASIADIPEGCNAMRAVDKAHTPPSEVNPEPDYTALSPLTLKDKDGFYYLLGNYHPKLKDEPRKASEKCVLGKVRRYAGERDNLIVAQMKSDNLLADTYKYREPVLVLSKDSGAGTGDFNATVARMAEEGIKVQKDMTISNVKGKKEKDFLGFTNACENGLVYLVEDTFEKDSLEAILKELEIFDGQPSTKTKKDDWPDSISMVYNAICKSKRVYRTLNQVARTSTTKKYKLYRK